jgi:hypothetical protein
LHLLLGVGDQDADEGEANGETFRAGDGDGCRRVDELGERAGPRLQSPRSPGDHGEPKVDGTDFYMFRSYEPGRAGFVTFIANYQPLQDPYGGPNYFTMDPDAIYEIHVDNNGNAAEDITFQFRFTNTLRGGNGVTLNVGGKTLPIPLRHIGPITTIDDPDLGETESYTLTVVTGDRRTARVCP